MRTRTLGLRSLVFLAAAGVAAFALGWSDLRTSAGDGGEVRLLVKCERDALPDVLRALTSRGATVWDLDTMTPLAAPPARTDRAPAPGAKRGVLPLPDATRVMQEILLAVQRLGGDVSPAVMQVEEMAVQPRRAMARVTAADPAAFDRLRRALAANGYLRSRAADPQRLVEPGAQQRLRDGRYRQAFSLRFDEHAGSEVAPAASAATSIEMGVVRRLLEGTGMLAQYAGPEQDDPNRARGYRTIAREFTFAPTTLDRLLRFLARVGGEEAGYTVVEVRWKRASPTAESTDERQLLSKPVVKLAVRRAL